MYKKKVSPVTSMLLSVNINKPPFVSLYYLATIINQTNQETIQCSHSLPENSTVLKAQLQIIALHR